MKEFLLGLFVGDALAEKREDEGSVLLDGVAAVFGLAVLAIAVVVIVAYVVLSGLISLTKTSADKTSAPPT